MFNKGAMNQRFGGGAVNQFQGQLQNFGQVNQFQDVGQQHDPQDFVPDQGAGFVTATSPLESPVKGKVRLNVISLNSEGKTWRHTRSLYRAPNLASSSASGTRRRLHVRWKDVGLCFLGWTNPQQKRHWHWSPTLHWWWLWKYWCE